MKVKMLISLLFSCLLLSSCNDNSEINYPINIETSIIQYHGDCIQYPDLQVDVGLCLVNSQEEMENYILECESLYPLIDFDQCSLILLFSKFEYTTYQLVQIAEDMYCLNIISEESLAYKSPGIRNKHVKILLVSKIYDIPELNLIHKQIENSENDIYPMNIKTIALQCPDSCIKFPPEYPSALGQGYLPVFVYNINTYKELQPYLYEGVEFPPVDFDKYTLMLVLTKSDFNIEYQLVQTTAATCRMDVTFELPYNMSIQSIYLFYGMKSRGTFLLIPRTEETLEVNLKFDKTTNGGYEAGYSKDVQIIGDYPLIASCWEKINQFDLTPRIYVTFVNSEEYLHNTVSEDCLEENISSVDFEQQSLLVVSSYGISKADYRVVQTSDNTFRLDIIYGYNSWDKKQLPVGIVVPKMVEKPEINVITLFYNF